MPGRKLLEYVTLIDEIKGKIKATTQWKESRESWITAKSSQSKLSSRLKMTYEVQHVNKIVRKLCCAAHFCRQSSIQTSCKPH